MRLFSVELRRFWRRRSNIIIVLLGLLFLIGSLAVVAFNSHAPTSQEVVEAEAEAEAEQRRFAAEVEECQQWWQDNPNGEVDEESPNDWEYRHMEGPEECEEYFGVPDISPDEYLDNVMSFETEAPTQLALLVAILVVAGLLMASSFIGAEWTSGGMTNLLLWNPRRLPVMTAKTTAVLASVLALTLVYAAFHMGSLYLIAHFDGRPGNLDSAWWQEHGFMALRLLVLILLATLCGAALSMIGRRTITAIGIVLGYVVLVEFAIRGMLHSVNLDVSGFLLSTYLQAWILEGAEIHNGFARPTSGSFSSADYEANVYYISTWAGGGVLLAVTAVLLTLAGWMFARRDTT